MPPYIFNILPASIFSCHFNYDVVQKLEALTTEDIGIVSTTGKFMAGNFFSVARRREKERLVPRFFFVISQAYTESRELFLSLLPRNDSLSQRLDKECAI